jgi:hypothetical protein
MMKKLICLGLILLVLTFLMPAKPSMAHGGGGFWPGLIIGGALAWSLAAPHYYYPRYYYPPPAYYYPPPAYYYPPPPPSNSPPTEVTPPSMPNSGGRIFIYPRQNQNEERQARDEEECHKWALGQTGYDPSKPLSGPPDAQTIQKSDEFMRAISACLDARGYTVR